jgi:radical SAM superfamily enzyme YgiQ (UPF0313 family)
MTKVALLFPPSPFLIDERVNPPLGLGYLSSYLQQHGIETELHHLAGRETPPENLRADVIGIGFTTPQLPGALSIMETLRRTNPDALFVAGGVHPTSSPQAMLDAGFDTVVVGEGERALLRVVKERSRGIVPSEEIRDIDELPYPDYDGLDIGGYHFVIGGLNFFSMFTSRGCPMSCAFCASPLMWKKTRMHSVEYVKQHILHVRERYGVQAIMFQDDVFTMKRSRIRDIGGFLRDLGMPYRCLARANNLDEETVKLLVETGCIEVGVGIESNSQQMLDVMNKRSTTVQNRTALLNCRKHGLSIKAFLLLGAPGESDETLQETFDLLEETQPNDIDSNVLVLYPGTEFYDHMDRYDIKQEVTDPSKQFLKGRIESYQPTISTSHLTPKELEAWKWRFFDGHSKLGRAKRTDK